MKETEIKELYAYKDSLSTYLLTVVLIPLGGFAITVVRRPWQQ